MGIADEFKKSMGEGVEAIVNRRCVFCWMDLAVKGKKKGIQYDWNGEQV